jgi:hypothetical protein
MTPAEYTAALVVAWHAKDGSWGRIRGSLGANANKAEYIAAWNAACDQINRRIRQYSGVAPKDEDLPVVLGEIDSWRLYQRRKHLHHRYLSLKLVAVGKAERKGNYWLGVDCTARDFTRVRDAVLLREHFPDLAAAVLALALEKGERLPRVEDLL